MFQVAPSIFTRCRQMRLSRLRASAYRARILCIAITLAAFAGEVHAGNAPPQTQPDYSYYHTTAELLARSSELCVARTDFCSREDIAKGLSGASAKGLSCARAGTRTLIPFAVQAFLRSASRTRRAQQPALRS